MCRGLTCLWLVAVTQFAALVVVTLVQQLSFADMTQQDVRLRGLLSDFLSSTDQDEHLSAEALNFIVGKSDVWESDDVETEAVTRHKRQFGYDAILADMLRAQERIIAGHCSNATKVCVPGPKGEPGLPGPAGLPGQNGVSGREGPRGEDGPMGSKGVAGVKGARGSAGPLGDEGPAGIAGVKGDMGTRGDRGSMGERGQSGLDGTQGPKGEPGLPGDAGPAGPKGAPGPPGQKGEQGGSGLKGSPGPEGPAGDWAVPLGSDCECLSPPRIVRSLPSDMDVTLNSAMQLNCQAEGNPAPQVTWSGHQSARLRIDRLLQSDLRPYTCTATNPFGTDSIDVTLHGN